MVRILHFADLHLDRSFAGVGMASSEASARREELRSALRRIVQLAIERDVDVLTIGGDLYEHDRVTPDTGHFLARQFKQLAPRRVLIAPGNHDPFLPDSLYRRFDWPENVHIFSDCEWRPVNITDALTIWGAAHDSPAVRQNLLGELRLDGGDAAVAVVHGSDMSAVPEQKVAHCPFEPRDVEECGASFVLLGHYHAMRMSPSGSPRYAYPGSPEPLGFDAAGPHYVLLLETNGTSCSAEPVRISEVGYRTESINVTGMTTSDEVRDALEALARDDVESPDIVRVSFTGEAEPTLHLDVDALLAAAAGSFRFLDLKDATTAPFDFDALADEATTRGAFVRLMRERITRAPDSEQPGLENALRYGLQAFQRQEVRPRAADSD